MKRYNLITPEGTKDCLLEECLIRRRVQEEFYALFRSKGYSEVTTPGLEFFDVFRTKSGSYPQELLYKMTDSKGRLLVMRPDSTTPIARVAATRLREASLPLRLCYSQTVYRFEQALKGRSDEIRQMGIELLGSAAYMADVEMVTTAIEVLRTAAGESCSFSLELGDAGVFKELMRELGAEPDFREEIRSLIESKNYPQLGDILDTLENQHIAHALKKLPSLFGGEEVFEKASRLYSNPRIDEILDDLRRLYEDIAAVIGKQRLTVDLGMVNNADYYTGVIIKGYLEGCGDEVLSGGRYNKLLSDFGYDIPATGFAVNVDAISENILARQSVRLPVSDVLVFAAQGYESEAVRRAEELRAQGLTVEYALFDTLDLVREYAADHHIARIVVVDEQTEVNR